MYLYFLDYFNSSYPKLFFETCIYFSFSGGGGLLSHLTEVNVLTSISAFKDHSGCAQGLSVVSSVQGKHATCLYVVCL